MIKPTNMQHKLLSFTYLLTCLFCVSAQAKTTAQTIDWDALIPKQAALSTPTSSAIVNHNGERAPQRTDVAYRTDLDGKRVKIPGFVIPLEGDDKVVTELLLVPYYGACIHVPPPPANQIVYVKFKQGAPLQGLWDTVYIEGTLSVQTTESEFAQAGYLLDGIKVTAYTEAP